MLSKWMCPTDAVNVKDLARSAEGELAPVSSVLGELRTPLRWGRPFHRGRVCACECPVEAASRRKR